MLCVGRPDFLAGYIAWYNISPINLMMNSLASFLLRSPVSYAVGLAK